MGGKGDGDARDMEPRPRSCNGIGQGVRGPGVYGAIGRFSASMGMADWALRAFDASAYRSSGSRTVVYEQNARGVTCVAQHTQRSRTERCSDRARFPPAYGAGAWSRHCMRMAWTGFVRADFLIAAVSCSDARGFSEQSAEVEFPLFENERT